MNSFCHNICRYIIAFLGCGGIALLTLWIVKSIPEEKIEMNVYQSSFILDQEGNHPYFFNSIWQLDNYTDAIMLNIALTNDSSSAFNQILLDKETLFPDKSQPIRRLKFLSENKINKSNVDSDYLIYGRYWHGYLITLKPLLCFFSLYHIRAINYLIAFVLLLISYIGISRKLPAIYSVLYLGLCLLFYFPNGPFSLQYTTCFFLMMIGISIICYSSKIREENNSRLFFFILGMATSFFDLLTFPIIPLCMCLLVYGGVTKFLSLKSLGFLTFNWLLGYTLFWSFKWVLVSVFTDFDMIGNALNQILIRTYSGSYKIADVIYDPYFICFLSIASLLIAANLLLIFRKYKFGKIIKDKNLYILIIGLYPLIWLMIAKNHTLRHLFFTYRIFSITFYCSFIYFYLKWSPCVRKSKKCI